MGSVPETLDQFRKLLLLSALITNDELARLTAEYDRISSCPIDESAAISTFCTFLVSAGALTAWQCDKLQQGRFKGFLVDQYLLLGHLGVDDEFSYFLARDIETGRQYRMTVTPLSRSQGDKCDYRVDEHLG